MREEIEAIEERLTVLNAQQGDRDAFSRLLDRYDKRLIYFVSRIVGETDAALDIVQSTWLVVYRKLPKLRSPEAFRAWLYRIAHDQAVSELRRKGPWPLPLVEAGAIEPEEPAGGDEAFDNAELVHRALQDLSIDHRRTLALHFLEDMPIDEIAEIMGCSGGTVKSRLYYAKRALRRRIEELLRDRAI